MYDCEDDFTGQKEPTCGWQLDAVTGAKIPLSQGFCCQCDLVNFSGASATRGTACSLIFNVGGGKSSAHCLRFSDSAAGFKAYTMQAPRLSYTIDFFVQVPIDPETAVDQKWPYLNEVVQVGNF